jgi:hypothetical protein
MAAIYIGGKYFDVKPHFSKPVLPEFKLFYGNKMRGK